MLKVQLQTRYDQNGGTYRAHTDVTDDFSIAVSSWLFHNSVANYNVCDSGLLFVITLCWILSIVLRIFKIYISEAGSPSVIR